MADNARIGITIDATDKTGPAFKSASQGSEQLASKMGKFQAGMKALPEQAGKAAAAMMLLQTSTGQLGGKMADAVNKIGAVVALMAVGGPLGIAIGAIAAGLAGLTSALEALYPPMDNVKNEFEEINEFIDDSARKLKPLIDHSNTLRDALLGVEEAGRTLEESLDDALSSGTRNTRLLAEMEDRLAKARIKRAEEVRRLAEERAELEQQRMRGMVEVQELQMEIWAQESEMLVRQAEREVELERNKQRLLKEARENEGKENEENVNKQLALELEANERENREKEEAARKTGAILGALSANLTEALISNSKDAKEAAIKATIDTAIATIGAKAAEGAAEAFEGAQELPFPAGLIVGPIVAGVIGGAILALRAKVRGMAQGGIVTGGVPGKDSVPAMLMPGERVIPASAAQDPFRQQSQSETVIINVGTIDATPAGRSKLAKEIAKEQRRNRRLGLDR